MEAGEGQEMNDNNGPSESAQGEILGERWWDSHEHSWKWEDEPLPDPTETSSVRISAVTWNMMGQVPPPNLTDLFPPNCKHHIYVVVAQECMRSIASSMIYASMRVWEAQVMQTLGPDYELLESSSIAGSHLAVYVHANTKPLISSRVEKDRVCTGFVNMFYNKGGMGISFKLGKSSLLAIGCHLSAGQKAKAKRCKDFLRIYRGLRVPTFRSPDTAGPDQVDFCLFMGDMNFRVDADRSIVDFLMLENMCNSLKRADQLKAFVRSNPIAASFSEGELEFPPTYRFDAGTNNYDTSGKQRIPAWTDRILYKGATANITQETYNSITSNCYSDHKPVFAQFTFKFEASDEAGMAGNQGSKACHIF